jgi:energy-coupling factor transport system permease protein
MNQTLDHRTDLDGFIKLLLAITLAVLPFYFTKPVSYGIFLVYLAALTLASRIKFRTLWLSAASYLIIVLIPYFFGILVNALIYLMTKNATLLMQQGWDQIALRLFRLFVIWYVSILYFHTTPMPTILGLLDKLLSPLKLMKVPVEDYLKVVMCIVTELKGTGEEMKTRFLDRARSVVGEGQVKLRFKINGISQIIVSSLVDSFQKLDRLESHMERVSQEELFGYKLVMRGPELITVFGAATVIYLLYVVEKGTGLII